MINKRTFFSSKGFTLAEFLVVIFVFLLILRVVYSSYLLSRKSYLEGEKMAETTQNGRVILERVIREIRQAREIVTELSEEESKATSTIEFEDGHVSEPYYYIRYFEEDGEVKKEITNYYFSGDTATLVPWDSATPTSQTKVASTSEARIIGEHVTDLGFWGAKIVYISLTLEKDGKILNLKTRVLGRNF